MGPALSLLLEVWVVWLLPFTCCVHSTRASSRSLLPARRAAESLRHRAACKVSPSQEKPFCGWVTMPGGCGAAGSERSSSPAQTPRKVAGNVYLSCIFWGWRACVLSYSRWAW